MNIIFVMSDTYRRDNLAVYGPSNVRTPNLSRFAETASVFHNARAGSFPTVPNRLDVFSGRFCHVRSEWSPMPRDAVVLQQLLTGAGLTTQMIVDNPHLLEDGFDYARGFLGWEWIRGQETDHWKTLPRDVHIATNPRKMRTRFSAEIHKRNTAWWQKEEDRFAARTITAACNWLAGAAEDGHDFYLYLDLFDPHEPWDAPKSYLDLYDPNYDGEEMFYSSYGFWKDVFTPREFMHLCAQYRAEATMVDRWFGVLLDKLDDLGLAEDTAVIFTSDHGYLFGEHDLTGKSLLPEFDGQFYYEAIPLYHDVRAIPLLIHMPGQRQRRDIRAQVQPVDLMPTILELGGVVATEIVHGQAQTQALQCGVFYTEDWQFDPAILHGRSLLPLLRGETDSHRDITVTSETIIHHAKPMAKSAIVTNDGWCLHYCGAYDASYTGGGLVGLKLVHPGASVIPTEPMLFNLREDPGETHNVIASNEALAREIHARYVAWLEEQGTPEEHLAGRRKLR